jgi:propanol-preferring alcohol dehydrogenase
MKAMVLTDLCSLEENTSPLKLMELPDPIAEAASLLCVGAIGYRSLRLSGLQDGQNIGLTGFGASGHLVLKMARHLHPRAKVFVFARSAAERAFSLELGAAWAGETAQEPPEKLDCVIDTTPAWQPVVEALKNLDSGGRLIINAIRKEERDKDSLLRIDYPRHLWLEKEIKHAPGPGLLRVAPGSICNCL